MITYPPQPPILLFVDELLAAVAAQRSLMQHLLVSAGQTVTIGRMLLLWLFCRAGQEHDTCSSAQNVTDLYIRVGNILERIDRYDSKGFLPSTQIPWAFRILGSLREVTGILDGRGSTRSMTCLQPSRTTKTWLFDALRRRAVGFGFVGRPGFLTKKRTLVPLRAKILITACAHCATQDGL